VRKIALILEGYGDVAAGCSLVAKTAATFGKRVYASDPPIRAGNAIKLKRTGELERYLRLAASREDVDQILLLVDLDDGCAAQFAADFNTRATAISQEIRKKIHICFCLREYESWFLASIDVIREQLPDYGIAEDVKFDEPETIRAAKGALDRACKNKGYKQMRDQHFFTKTLDIKKLATRSRSFRKFLKCVLDTSYDELSLLLQ
jgi:Domain of unknown function (DUF4276)